jgi:hypothetical protein
MIRRVIAVAAVLTFIPFMAAQADEPGGQEIYVPPPAPVVTEEQPVSAVPPPFVEMERTSIGAGIGISWGSGTITFEGREYGFSAKGLSLGDLGATKDVTVGEVHNLTNLADFEGRYVAVEAGAAAGVGASALTMRNEKGVVISVTSSLRGGRLTLGPEGLRIALK